VIGITGGVVGITNAMQGEPSTDIEGFDHTIAIDQAMPATRSLISEIP
jgi:hypothetical protein